MRGPATVCGAGLELINEQAIRGESAVDGMQVGELDKTGLTRSATYWSCSQFRPQRFANPQSKSS